MGSTVISGAAKGIVFETGNRTFLGTIARNLTGHRATTAFDKGISKVSLLLIRFMLVMVPFVFFINGFTKGLVRGFHLRHFGSRGTHARDASDDCNREPL